MGIEDKPTGTSKLNPDILSAAGINPAADSSKEDEVSAADKAALELEEESHRASTARELEEEYIETSSIKILPITDILVNSLYRKLNNKVMLDRVDKIGSSIKAVRMLMSGTEMETYMPKLLGVSAKHDTFAAKVKVYFNNISTPVSNNGLDLDTTFIWNRKGDYIDFKNKFDIIESNYDNEDKSDVTKLHKAITIRVEKLNNLESAKYKYGTPRNISDYLMYRYCLLYKDVAKDISLAHSDMGIRFYIKDYAKDTARLEKLHILSKRAKQLYLQLVSEDKADRFNAVYTMYIISHNLNRSTYDAYDSISKERLIDAWSTKDPAKFISIANDNKILDKAFIENLITAGILNRAAHNQQITTADGEFVGENVNAAIGYFNNPTNAELKTIYKQQLKQR